MTQKYGENIGARDFAAGGQDPQSKTYDVREGTVNRLNERMIEITFDEIATTSSDAVIAFKCPDNGKISSVTLVNGTVAADGTNGLELSFINKTNADDVVAYVGFGSGTEAAKATDADTAVATHETASVKVTDTSTCNKDDKIQCTIDRDGTTINGYIMVEYDVSSEGR